MKKPQEAQKAKALWKMKAAKDAGEEYYDPDRKDKILRSNNTKLALWEEHRKDPIVAVDNVLKCVWRIRAGNLGPSAWWKGVSQWRPLASSKVCGRSRCGRTFGLPWIRWIGCVHAQRRWSGMCQKSAGRVASSFFLIQKEPAARLDSETFSPFYMPDFRTSLFSADVLKKCTLTQNSLSLSHTHSHTHSRTHTHTLAHTLSHTHSHTHSFSHTLTHTHALSHTHTHSSHTLTHS